MSAVVLDSQAVSVLAESRRSASIDRARSVLTKLLDRGATPIIPASVVAETRRGRRADAVDRVLNAHLVVPIDRAVAADAAKLLDRCALDSAHLADALVAAIAVRAERPAVIITSDPGDLRALTAHLTGQVTVLAI